MLANGVRVCACDLNVCNRARLPVVERRVEMHAWLIFQLVHPVAREIPESSFFARGAYALMKEKRLADCQTLRGGARARLLELAYVCVLTLLGCEERPDVFYLVFADVEQARAL